MSLSFVYNAAPGRVLFGAGSLARLGEEVRRLGLGRVLVLATPSHEAEARDLAAGLGSLAAGVHAKAVMHVPAAIARAASEEARRLAVDGTVALGGGSAIGLAKAVALELGLPILAVPTTYSGSEMTPIWGLTEGGIKKTGRDPRVLPRTVIYDPALILNLPPAITAVSGMNAMAHCVHGGGGVAPPGMQPAGRGTPAGGSGRARRDALRRLACRGLSRQRRHGPASQAVSHPGRQLQLAPCGDPYGGSAPCRGL